MLTSFEDVHLPEPLHLKLERKYSPAPATDRALSAAGGRKSLDEALHVEGCEVVVRLGDGRGIAFLNPIMTITSERFRVFSYAHYKHDRECRIKDCRLFAKNS